MIVTCWLNAVEDPHYKRTVAPDRTELSMLDTLGGRRAVVLSDCLEPGRDGNVSFVRVDPIADNPYFARWQHIADWCEHRDDFVWCTDAGDVRLLNDPYPAWLDNSTLYVGAEPDDGPNERSVGFWWVQAIHPAHGEWIAANASRRLMNPGILGGHTSVVAAFARQIGVWRRDGDVTDMVAANRTVYSWRGPVVTGDQVHTPMWSFQTEHPTAVWAHK